MYVENPQTASSSKYHNAINTFADALEVGVNNLLISNTKISYTLIC